MAELSATSFGKLVITARKEELTGPDGILRHYTSARLNTQSHFTQKYGRFEARIQLPTGKGIWPAFWLLGDNHETAPWPKCGEIDILEGIGAPDAIVRNCRRTNQQHASLLHAEQLKFRCRRHHCKVQAHRFRVQPGQRGRETTDFGTDITIGNELDR